MEKNKKFISPVIDVEATSRNLKVVREKNNVKIVELQNLFGMENPQSIYNWEDENKKILPRLDNLIILAKYYSTSIDDLVILKNDETGTVISERACFYNITTEVEDYLIKNCKADVILALKKFY